MSLKKIIITSLLTAGICSAHAEPLKLIIVNNTHHDSVSKINGVCSSSFHIPGLDDGITKKDGGKKEVSEFQIRLACRTATEHCIAEVYVNDSHKCEGPVIGKVDFNISQRRGVTSVTEVADGYTFAFEPNKITLAGGPN